ncbi:MAG: signal transduction histidine kinase [Bradymonadia bacterium]|jgi:signal transduction histidine kinase
MMPEALVLGGREIVLLTVGAVILLGSAFVGGRVLRGFRHGFSIRLQLFFAIFGTAVISAGVIGLWAVERLQSRAEELGIDGSYAVTQLLTDFSPKMAFLVVLLGVVAATAAWLLGHGLAGPIEKLTRAAEIIAEGQRSSSLPPPSGREVRRLTAAFDQMRRALLDRHSMERFVADLSHELKNPVSAIRAATEVLQEGAAEDPAARARFLGRIGESVKRLEGLLHDLLALARLEAHGIDARSDLVDVAAVVRVAVRDARAEGSVDLDLADVRVRGDARWLRRMVDNLLSNAARYRTSRVAIALEIQGGSARLVVHDDGPGVPAALQGRIFERFVTDRADVGGTGLGLSIVRSVAEHHGGEARWIPTEVGARFEVTLRVE